MAHPQEAELIAKREALLGKAPQQQGSDGDGQPSQPAEKPPAATDKPPTAPKLTAPAGTAPPDREGELSSTLNLDYKSAWRALKVKHEKVAQAYRTLQGKYNAEIKGAKGNKHVAQANQSADPEALMSVLKKSKSYQDAVENVGEGWADTMIDMVSAALSTQAVQQPIPAESGDPTAVDEDDDYILQLDQLFPSWDLLYLEQDFRTWLAATVDPLSGRTYKELLLEAGDSSDAKTAALIFRAYTPTRSEGGTPQQRDRAGPPIEPQAGGGPGTDIDGSEDKYPSDYLQQIEKLRRQAKITEAEWEKRRNAYMAWRAKQQ